MKGPNIYEATKQHLLDPTKAIGSDYVPEETYKVK